MVVLNLFLPKSHIGCFIIHLYCGYDSCAKTTKTKNIMKLKISLTDTIIIYFEHIIRFCNYIVNLFEHDNHVVKFWYCDSPIIQ